MGLRICGSADVALVGVRRRRRGVRVFFFLFFIAMDYFCFLNGIFLFLAKNE